MLYAGKMNNTMSKIINKWYFGLIIIPVIVNLLTNTIELPVLFKNWTYTLLVTMAIAILVLITELMILNRKFIRLKEKPKESDKVIIKKLLATLNVDMFHKEIKNKDGWYGYLQEAIHNTIEFVADAGLISNKTTDKKLNSLIEDFKNSLDKFNNFSAVELFPNGLFYTPAKDTEYNKKRAEEARQIMNRMTDTAFKKLTTLFEYLKDKNYLERNM